MSRLVPYQNETMAQDSGPTTPAPPVSTRLEAIGKFIPSEILAFYLPASGAAELAGENLAVLLQWVTFFLSWIAVPAYFYWIARDDDRLWRQTFVSTLAFPIWVMASGSFWPVPWIAPNPGLALWLLALFSLVTAFLLPPNRNSRPVSGMHA